MCKPTWRGHIETTKDALLIFEACFNGTLAHCFRRPHDRERSSVIVSGNVFVYEEGTSGIKRWTDGIPWSPSRILTNFLIYRQLNSPFPPGEKKRAMKRSQRPVRPGEPYAAPVPSSSTDRSVYSADSEVMSTFKPEEGNDKDIERTLVGSLVDSYDFKEHGLLKKTMTVVVNNVQHHLVSYYSLDDAKHHLRTPREDPRLKDQTLREELLQQPRFKFPNLDDAGDGVMEQLAPSVGQYAYLPQLNTVSTYPKAHSAQASPQDHSPHSYYPNLGAFTAPPFTQPTYTQYPMALVSPLSQTCFPSTPTTFSPQRTPQPLQDSIEHEPQPQQFQWPSLFRTSRTLSLPSQRPTPRFQSSQLYAPTSSSRQDDAGSTIPATHTLRNAVGLSSQITSANDYGAYAGFYAPTASLPASMAESAFPHPPHWHNPFPSSLYAATPPNLPYPYRAAS